MSLKKANKIQIATNALHKWWTQKNPNKISFGDWFDFYTWKAGQSSTLVIDLEYKIESLQKVVSELQKKSEILENKNKEYQLTNKLLRDEIRNTPTDMRQAKTLLDKAREELAELKGGTYER